MAERASIYHGFNAETDIRLFRVRTSFLHRSKIRIEFCVTNLSSAGPYIAISYEWGSDQIRSRIERDDGFQIGLTESAAEIIYYVLGKRRRKSWVWMDAICIDQKNETEKRHQIALMGKIYSSASQVLACIGPHLRGGDEALKFVPKVYNILREYQQNGYKPTWTIARRLVNLDPGMIRWAALWTLLRSSFFERMWITQEMVMAPCTSPTLEEDKGLMITCRKEDLSFMIIVIVAQELGKLGTWLKATIPGDDQSVPRGLICAQNMGAFRQSRLNGQAISLSNALRACVYYKAKYGVDRIYAVMNFVQDPLKDDLRSDITELFSNEADSIRRAGAVEDPVPTSREEDAISTRLRERKDSERWTREEVRLFTLVATFFLKRELPFQFLSMAGIGWPVRLSYLPSWVPDWNREEVLVPFGGYKRQRLFKTSLDQRQLPFVNSETGELSVELIIIDHVQRIFAHAADYRKRSPKRKVYDPDRTIVTPASSLLPSWLTPMELSEIEAFPADEQSYVHPVSEARQFASQSSYYKPWRDSIESAVMGPFLVGDGLQEENIDMARAFNTWLRWAEELRYTPRDIELEKFNTAFITIIGNFKVMFGTSTQGFLGWGPSSTHKNDVLCIIVGALTPFLLRPVDKHGLDETSTTQKYQLVGECYVQGLMNGEGLTMGERQRCVLI